MTEALEFAAVEDVHAHLRFLDPLKRFAYRQPKTKASGMPRLANSLGPTGNVVVGEQQGLPECLEHQASQNIS